MTSDSKCPAGRPPTSLGWPLPRRPCQALETTCTFNSAPLQEFCHSVSPHCPTSCHGPEDQLCCKNPPSRIWPGPGSPPSKQGVWLLCAFRRAGGQYETPYDHLASPDIKTTDLHLGNWPTPIAPSALSGRVIGWVQGSDPGFLNTHLGLHMHSSLPEGHPRTGTHVIQGLKPTHTLP